MTKISSPYTFFTKTILPLLWFGVIACLFVNAIIPRDKIEAEFGPDPALLLPPVLMAVFGIYIVRNLLWGLAAEVYDCGNSLLIRKRAQEESVPFANIMNVTATAFTNPARITIRLVKPGRFGNEIAFLPVKPFTLNPFAKSRVAEDLIARVRETKALGSN